jgi:protein-S-isoprenylcysteine O-methyltransferase Ste14
VHAEPVAQVHVAGRFGGLGCGSAERGWAEQVGHVAAELGVSGRVREAGEMRRSAAVVTSVLWFVLTGGVGGVLVPWWLTGWRARHPFPYWGVAQVVGVVLIVAGLIPPLHVFAQFVRAGGTPMPGAMPTRLVVTGLNRYVRNPIYLGAVTIFVGEALLLGRLSLLLYAVAAGAGVAAFVRWYEEPALARRFGAEYEVYRAAVPAWLPRRHPWDPNAPVGPR